jgi:hypothetical protein
MYRRYAADKKNKNNSLNKCMVTGKTKPCLERTRSIQYFTCTRTIHVLQYQHGEYVSTRGK